MSDLACTCGLEGQDILVILPRHHAPDCPVRLAEEGELRPRLGDPRERFTERGEEDPRRSLRRGRRKPEDLGRG